MDANAAYIIGMAANALIEAMGMHADNQHRLSRGETIAYDEKAFQELIERTGIHHNGIVSMLRE